MLTRHFFFLLTLSLLGGCATTSEQRVLQGSSASEFESQSPVAPNLDLTQPLLESLLIANFSSYAGEWQAAADAAKKAALDSNDYRVARLAAVLSLRANDYLGAAEVAALWHQLDGQNPNSFNTLLIALLGAEQLDETLRQIDLRLANDNNMIAEKIREVAGISVRQPNADAAIGVMQYFIDKYPHEPQSYLSASFVAEKFEHEEVALEWVHQALKLKPNWGDAAQMKYSLLRKQGKDKESLAYLENYVERHPRDVSMRLNLAVERAREKKYAEAYELTKKALKREPKNVSALVYAAALAQELDQREIAVEYYQRALKEQPDNDEVRWSLARFAVEEEKFAEAELHYQQMLSDNYFFQAQLQIANMRYQIEGIKPALKHLRSIQAETEEEFTDIATTRHYLLMQSHRYADALGYINEALVLLPDDLDLLYARALVAAELGEIPIAETDLRFIIEKRPKHANALNALGYTLADRTERFQEAMELIEKALELRPEDAHILDSMGWVLYRMKDYEAAIDYLQRAYVLSSEVEIAAHLGEVYWEKGDQAKARTIWLDALKADADNPILKRTLARYGVEPELNSDTIVQK